MPKAATHRLLWSATDHTYQVQEAQEQLALEPHSPAWFAWVDQISSFAFWGQRGHYTARKERRPRGTSYWYAYVGRGKHLTKTYLGKTSALTLTRLEEVAEHLTAADDSPDDTPTERPESLIVAPTAFSVNAVPGYLAQEEANTPFRPQAGRSSQRDLLLATKLHPPQLSDQMVSRPQLTSRLQQGVKGALTLVSAPAGFGKTTLLTQWLAETRMPVAWLSLDAEDNDPIRFLSYLLSALQRSLPHLSLTVSQLLEAAQATPLESVFAVLTNNLLAHDTSDFALVLDDYHLITNQAIHQALIFLVHYLPPHLHLVLATRADPPLPLASLRAKGRLLELRANDLRLDRAEIRTFLQRMLGFDLPPEALEILAHRSEGWAAGLQLAALSLRGRADLPAFVAAFTGSHRFVLDYFSEEVLSRQPQPVQSFLLRTAILERLSGPLCEAVTGQDGGQARLEALERANLFVVPLDEERHWFRYHQLLGDVLKSRLMQAEPELVPDLHRRASGWYERQGLLPEAVQHALLAQDVELAARLMDQPVLFASLMAQGRPHLLLEWFQALPDEVVRARPLLCIYHASALHVINQVEAAEARVQDAERALEVSPSAEAKGIALSVAANIRANLARYQGDLERYLTLGQQALDLLPEAAPLPMRAVPTMQVAHRFLVSGEMTVTIEQQVREAVAVARASRYELVTFRCLTLQARLHHLQGRLRTAAAVYETAGQATPAAVAQVLTAKATYCFGLGDLLREWNHLEEAEHLLTQGVEQVRDAWSSFADEVLAGHVALARLLEARGQSAQAIAALEAFVQVAEERRVVPRMHAAVAAARAQLELMQGHVEAADRWAQASGLSTSDEEVSYAQEAAYLILARIRIARAREHTAIPLPDVLTLLDRLLAAAEARGRRSSVLEILIVQALALHALHDRLGALATLERALTLAAPEGYVRLFVDEGAPMRDLLRTMRSRRITSSYVALLLAAFEPKAGGLISAPLHPEGLIEPLTPREHEVLHLLAEGASNREIAHRLVLSPGTVKKYVRTICGKLGAQSRTHALIRAQTLRLL